MENYVPTHLQHHQTPHSHMHSHFHPHSQVENYALTHLQYLTLPSPPPGFFESSSGLVSSDTPNSWTDSNIKRCLYLYLEIVPVNHSLLHDLATAYTNASG